MSKDTPILPDVSTKDVENVILSRLYQELKQDILNTELISELLLYYNTIKQYNGIPTVPTVLGYGPRFN